MADRSPVPGGAHFVDTSVGELVGCPLSERDVELDTCLTCPRLRDLYLGSSPPFIVCSGRRRRLPLVMAGNRT